MNKITLDFTNCKYIGEIHTILKKKFKFPDYYGENLSALWDCLRDYCDEDSTVYIKGVDSLPNDLREYMHEKIFGIFNDIHEETPTITFIEISS